MSAGSGVDGQSSSQRAVAAMASGSGSAAALDSGSSIGSVGSAASALDSSAKMKAFRQSMAGIVQAAMAREKLLKRLHRVRMRSDYIGPGDNMGAGASAQATAEVQRSRGYMDAYLQRKIIDKGSARRKVDSPIARRLLSSRRLTLGSTASRSTLGSVAGFAADASVGSNTGGDPDWAADLDASSVTSWSGSSVGGTASVMKRSASARTLSSPALSPIARRVCH